MVILARALFEKTKIITYERYKLSTRSQVTGETLKLFLKNVYSKGCAKRILK